jgi:hypothetical protein
MCSVLIEMVESRERIYARTQIEKDKHACAIGQADRVTAAYLFSVVKVTRVQTQPTAFTHPM